MQFSFHVCHGETFYFELFINLALSILCALGYFFYMCVFVCWLLNGINICVLIGYLKLPKTNDIHNWNGVYSVALAHP